MNFSPIFLLALPYALSAMDTPPQDPTNDQPWVSAKSLGGDTYLAVKRIETTPVHEIPELKNKIPKSALFNALKQLIKFPFTLEEWEMLDACNITERVIEIKDRTPKMKKVREQIGWFPTILEEPAIWPRGCFKHQKYTQCTCTDEKHTEETPTLPNTISYWIAPQESPCAYSHNKSNSDRAELIPQVHPANHPEILTIRIVKHHQQNHLPLLEQHIVTIQNPKESHQYANFEVLGNNFSRKL